MKNVISIVFVVFTLLFMFSCSTQPEKNNEKEPATESAEKQLIVYGSNSCDHCLFFRDKLDSAGINYVFHDVEQNQQLADQMLEATKSINYQGFIQFPVVVIEENVLVNPSFEEALKVINQ
jgi:glutaredoxin